MRLALADAGGSGAAHGARGVRAVDRTGIDAEAGMDVTLRPPLGGCLMALITLLTLGTYPLLRRFGERHFIRRMDDAGFETRSGKRIAWGDVTRAQRTVATMGAARLSDEILLHTRRGRASLPSWRTENAKEALDYLNRRLPPEARLG